MKVNGLPLHILIVHAVVVLIPLTALVISLSAIWPAARRRIGIVGPALALVITVLVPVTVEAGEWLQARLPDTPLIRDHAELGGTILPYVIGMLVAATATWVLHRWWRPSGERARLAVTVGVAVLTVAVSAAATWQAYRIGDSGARAVWTGNVSPTPLGR